MAKTTRIFLLAALVAALAVSGVCALPSVGGFLLGRALGGVLVFPGMGRGPVGGTAGSTAATLVAFALALTGGGYLAFRWAGFGGSRLGVLVCWGLAGGPAGVLAVLMWTRLQDVPFRDYVTYAASWGMATALLSVLPALAVTRVAPGGPHEPAEPGKAAKKTTWAFRPRGWVLPSLVAGWSVVWSSFPGRQELLAWLPLSLGYFDQVAVVLAAVAAGSLEGVLRRRLPVEGRPGRAFVLAWIALTAAPVVYAAVVAIDRGMRELLLADPLGWAWAARYLRDLGTVLIAEPAQVAVPPLLLALAATGLQTVVPARERPAAAPDPVRPDRRWSLLVAGAAVALTYFCLAVTSRFALLTRRTFDEETPAPLRALALLAPPDPALGRTVVVWSWAVVAAFVVTAAALVYVAVRGQLVRLFPASDYLVLTGALALATALAWNIGSVIGSVIDRVVGPAVTGERPLDVSPAREAAAFTGFVVPVFGALLFIVHSQAGLTRFVRIVELEGEEGWAKLRERYRAWRERVRPHVPSRGERGLAAARAGGAALVIAVVAGAFQGFGAGPPAGRVDAPFLAVPVLSVTRPPLENLTAALYVVLLAGLVYLAFARLNTKERRAAPLLAVWGLSVVAGGLAGLFDPVTGLQTGLVAGPLVAAALVVPLRRKLLLYGAALLVLVAAAPAVKGSPARERVALSPVAWREQRPRLTIDVSYPRAQGPDAARIDAALAEPVREAVERASRDLRADPAATGAVTSTYVVVRNDADVISVRYMMAGDVGRAVNYDRAAGRALAVQEIFAPAVLTPAGRRRLADALRPLMPPPQNPRTVSVDNDRVLVNLATGAVEFTFGRGYYCAACEPFTVRASRERLAGLLRH
ncbi:hypothetical protein ACIBQ1_29950 [Nonomuraea sp. NPDC050153]|uniref:hypothetical protein n=1 Tax=Nonomuraea sp. NPDC050153 TaxID=3364359 RepID=UPI0037896CE7